MFKREKTYFVSYECSREDGKGFGNVEISCSKIKSYEDVKNITQEISKCLNLKKVIILYWTELKR